MDADVDAGAPSDFFLGGTQHDQFGEVSFFFYPKDPDPCLEED